MSEKNKQMIKQMNIASDLNFLTEGVEDNERFVEIYGEEASINGAGRIDVFGHVWSDDLQPFMRDGGLTISFGVIAGDFDCSNRNLDVLTGCPWRVSGTFSCTDNDLTSLEGAPEKVNGNFYCRNNKINTLVDAPEFVGGTFDCSHNELRSLDGDIKVIKEDLICMYNPLESTEHNIDIGGDLISDN